MQASAITLLHLHNAPCSFIPTTDLKTTAFRRQKNITAACRGSQQDFPVTEYNLYELLGVDAASDRSQIKEAYRGLQKRCHPDVAGAPGHDMAIVLNEAYALLSDPSSRMAYDKELAKVADLQGYTGRPIYSAWFGSESEQRAIFVDEVKCVGCLKCALFAQNTFAIESVYGRARVVAQWADPEHKIHDAIGTCPVDCISIVKKSELPALEFVMSKLPRGSVRVGAGNTTGVRAADIFDEVEKFQARYAQHTASNSHFKDSDSKGSSRASAVQAIQMISNWLYWQSPITDAAAPLATQDSKYSTTNHARSTVKRLKAAVEARKRAATTARPKASPNTNDDYWVPAALALPHATTPDSASTSQVGPRPSRTTNPSSDAEILNRKKNRDWGNPFGLATSIVAAVVVRLQLGEPVSGLKEHVGGSWALTIVNSPWMQVALAGATWYLIGMYMVELVAALRRK